MTGESFIEKQEENISIHIFSVSAAMVGVCITVITLLNINKSLRKIETLGDNLIALDSMLFLISCILSYLAIRTQAKKRRFILEKTADWIFLLALSLIAVVSILIVWELA